MFKRILPYVLWALIVANTVFLVVRLGETLGWFAFGPGDHQVGRFRRVLHTVEQNYFDPAAATAEKLTDRALAEMVHGLDPHSEFLARREYEKVQDDLKSEFGGIGVQIELRDEKVLVIAPIAGTPGERAGILRGDQIAKVDGRELERPLVSNAVERLRGRPGTMVHVTLFRPSTAQSLELELTREIIKVETVRAVTMLENHIGYVQLTQFTERTAPEFRDALARLEGQGMRALVLDLRNNPGGLLTAAVDVLEPFFRNGELVVYTQGRETGSRRDLHAGAGADDAHRPYPIAVLVNSGSASAAEIVTGALRDTHRAVVVGERTFGKGSVQTLIPLPDGEALRLTTARYFTPGGRVINGHGIAPDVELPVSVEDDRRLGIQRLRDDYASPAEFKARFGFEPISDRQREVAIDVLTGLLATGGGPVPAMATAGAR